MQYVYLPFSIIISGPPESPLQASFVPLLPAQNSRFLLYSAPLHFVIVTLTAVSGPRKGLNLLKSKLCPHPAAVATVLPLLTL